MSEGPVLALELWPDEGERGKMLEDVDKEQEKEVRMQAFLQLRGKATVQEHRQALWDDEQIRAVVIEYARGPDPDAPQKSMYDDGPEIPDEDVRVVCLGIMVQLSVAAVVRAAMANDPAVITCLLMAPPSVAAGEEQSEWLRQRGWLALVGVAVAGACSTRYERKAPGGNDVTDGLLLGLSSTEKMIPSVRSALLGCFWTVAMSEEVDRRAMWKYTPLRDAAILCAEPGEPCSVRENALGLLWAIAVYDSCRVVMWSYEGARTVLIKSATRTWMPKDPEVEDKLVDPLADMLADSEEEKEEGEEEEDALKPQPQPPEVRARALSALAALAAEEENREAMWTCKPLAVALLEAMELTEAVNVRCAAIAVLNELSLRYENQLPMYGADVHTLFAAVAADEAFPAKERRICRYGAPRIQEGAELAMSWIKHEEELAAAAAAAAAAEAAAGAAVGGE